MATDPLVTVVNRPSAAMILTMYGKQNIVSCEKGFDMHIGFKCLELKDIVIPI